MTVGIAKVGAQMLWPPTLVVCAPQARHHISIALLYAGLFSYTHPCLLMKITVLYD